MPLLRGNEELFGWRTPMVLSVTSLFLIGCILPRVAEQEEHSSSLDADNQTVNDPAVSSPQEAPTRSTPVATSSH